MPHVSCIGPPHLSIFRSYSLLTETCCSPKSVGRFSRPSRSFLSLTLLSFSYAWYVDPVKRHCCGETVSVTPVLSFGLGDCTNKATESPEPPCTHTFADVIAVTVHFTMTSVPTIKS